MDLAAKTYHKRQKEFLKDKNGNLKKKQAKANLILSHQNQKGQKIVNTWAPV